MMDMLQISDAAYSCWKIRLCSRIMLNGFFIAFFLTIGVFATYITQPRFATKQQNIAAAATQHPTGSVIPLTNSQTGWLHSCW
jgi:hypothetical protein